MSEPTEITTAPPLSAFPPAPQEARPEPPKKRAARKTARPASENGDAPEPVKKRATRAKTEKILVLKPIVETPKPVEHAAPVIQAAPVQQATPAENSAPVKKLVPFVQEKSIEQIAPPLAARAPEVTPFVAPLHSHVEQSQPPPVAHVAVHQAPAQNVTETSAPLSAPQIISTAPAETIPAVSVSTSESPRIDQHPPREGGRRHWRDRQRDKQRNREQNQGHHGGQQSGHQNDHQQQRELQPERPLGPPEPADGILELTLKGFGFLRQKSNQFAQIPTDPFVSPEWVRKLGLREGMFIKGITRMGHRGPQVTEITEVMGMSPEKARDLPLFEELKAVNPNKRIQLETRADRITTRIIDIITPVGRGQRGLIVAPPRAGKTTLLEHIAEAIVLNHPTMHLMVLLVDERPEEVTEFRRALPNSEIHASSNDSDVKSHMRTATFAIERAKRLVEAGQHVFMLLDSITRMGRAFNNGQRSGGPTMSGGVGVGALEMPRRLFAAARNTRDAGSLTILATTLIETGSKMDELIFQEFKGTGNLELVLDRKIAEQYVYPAVNIFRSGTRREELLLPAFQMEKIHILRRGLGGHKPMEAIQRVIMLMERSPNNAQMLVELPGRVN